MHRQFLIVAFLAFSAARAAVAADGPVAPPADKPVPGQGVFVAVGYGGFRGWSLDGGQTWNSSISAGSKNGETDHVATLIYHRGAFFAAGGQTGRGFIQRSTDGQQWDEVVTRNQRILLILSMGDHLISDFDGQFQLSADGLTWKPAAEAKLLLTSENPSQGGGGFERYCAAGNGVAVMAGDYSVPGTSVRIGWIGGTKDGEPVVTTRVSTNVCGLAFGNGHFVACAADGTLLVSADGLQFKPTSMGGQYSDGCVRFHDGLFYLFGGKGPQTSPDGEHWTPLANRLTLPRAVSPDGVAVYFGSEGISFAADGKTWHRATVSGNDKGICAAVYGVPLANLPKDDKAKKKIKKP